MDSFIFHLILLTIPGFLGLMIGKILSSISKERKRIADWNDVLSLISFSFISCLLYDSTILIIAKISRITTFKSTIEIIQNSNDYYTTKQFLILVIINIIMGLIYATVYNKKLLYKVAKKLKITKQFGEEDVWAYVNNSDDIEWVYLRNYKNGLTYHGYIQLFSDSGEKREVLLSDVSIYYTDTAEYLYSLDKVYLCLDDYDISIEIPIKEKEDAKPSRESAESPQAPA